MTSKFKLALGLFALIASVAPAAAGVPGPAPVIGVGVAAATATAGALIFARNFFRKR